MVAQQFQPAPPSWVLWAGILEISLCHVHPAEWSLNTSIYTHSAGCGRGDRGWAGTGSLCSCLVPSKVAAPLLLGLLWWHKRHSSGASEPQSQGPWQ